jgi:hypothetical protein
LWSVELLLGIKKAATFVTANLYICIVFYGGLWYNMYIKQSV